MKGSRIRTIAIALIFAAGLFASPNFVSVTYAANLTAALNAVGQLQADVQKINSDNVESGGPQSAAITASEDDVLAKIPELQADLENLSSPGSTATTGASNTSGGWNSITSSPASGGSSAPSGWDSITGSGASGNASGGSTTSSSGGGATTGTQSAAPQLRINGGTSASLSNGSWTLALTSGPANTSLTLCYLANGNQNCAADWGETNASGDWSESGSGAFPSSDDGTWSEWVVFPGGTESNVVTFVVTSASGTGTTISSGTSGSTATTTTGSGSTTSGTTTGNGVGSNGASSPELSIDGGTSAAFAVGASWSLSFVGGPGNTPFTICAVVNGNQTCTPNFATTNANGSWTDSGSFSSANVGSWTEWLVFPGNVDSNQISFTVGAGSKGSGSSSGASPQLMIDGGTSATFSVGSAWSLSLMSGPANTAFTICAIVSGNQSCTPNFGTTNASGAWSDSGTFSSSNAGSWTEWIVFPGSVNSNVVSFAVSALSGKIGAQTSGPVPVLTTVQGYNPTTNTYEKSASIVNAGDTYVILYGTFASSGNTVSINGKALPASDITAQNANQINVLIGASYAGVPFTVSVTDANGTSAVVSANGTTSTSTPSTPSPSGSITKTITSGGTSYSVTYSYLADGEVRATFTYQGQEYAEQNYNEVSDSPNYTGLALVQSNGSLAAPPITETANGVGSNWIPLLNLASQIDTDAPQKQIVFPGFTFQTPLWTVGAENNTFQNDPPNAYLVVGSPSGPFGSGITDAFYELITNADGGLIELKSVTLNGSTWTDSLSAPGSHGYYFAIGGGWVNEYDNSSGQAEYQIYSPMLTQAYVLLKNVTVTNTQITGQAEYMGSTNLSSPVTFTLGQSLSSEEISASGLQVMNFNNPNAGQQSFLIVQNGQLANAVNAGGAAAYQYVITNKLNDVRVIETTSEGYAVEVNNSPVAAFDETGKKVVFGPTTATMSHAALQAAISQAVGFQAAIAVAKSAGYIVEVNSSSTDFTAVILDPQTNVLVAAISQSDD